MPFSLPLVLAVAGLLLIAFQVARTEKQPLWMLAGLGLVFAAGVAHLLADVNPLLRLSGFFLDVGLGLLLASLLLWTKKAGPRPFFAMSVISLTLAAAFYLIVRLLGGSPGAETEAASLLLELGPDDTIEEVAPILDRHGITYEQAFPTVSLEMDADLSKVYLLRGAWKVLRKVIDELLEDHENVDAVEWNEVVQLAPPSAGSSVDRSGPPLRLANDPLAARQWALETIGADAVHAVLRDLTPARRARVAILDTGVDAAHEDIRAVFSESPGRSDAHGHGTHCAGIAGAATDNGLGVASLNWQGRFVEVASYRALPLNGAGTFESIAQAIIDAANDGADVLSLSLGQQAAVVPKVVVDAVEYALRRGAIVVASAGNANRDARDHMPSNIEGVIAVAAVGPDLEKAAFSNTIGSLTRPIAAPGVDILSLKPDGAYAPLSGTSMATPMVAGLLGVLRSLDPSISADEAYALLRETGRSVPASEQIGRVIDAEAAVNAVLEGAAVPALVTSE